MVGTLDASSPRLDRLKDLGATTDANCGAIATDSFNDGVPYRVYSFQASGNAYAVVVSSYGTCEGADTGSFEITLGPGRAFITPCPADTNGDGLLTGADFNAALTSFLAGCPSPPSPRARVVPDQSGSDTKYSITIGPTATGPPDAQSSLRASRTYW